MQLDITPLGERLVKVTLEGRLDTQGVERIETRFLAAMVPGGKNAIVDMSKVVFLASLGIRMLVSAARSLKMRQARIVVYAPSPQVREVFDAAALGQVMTLCADEAEALAVAASPV